MGVKWVAHICDVSKKKTKMGVCKTFGYIRFTIYFFTNISSVIFEHLIFFYTYPTPHFLSIFFFLSHHQFITSIISLSLILICVLNFQWIVKVGCKIFYALGEIIKLCAFNYSNIFLLAFFVAKDSFIIKIF